MISASRVDELVRELHKLLRGRSEVSAIRIEGALKELTGAVRAARQQRLFRIRDGIPKLLEAHDDAVGARQRRHAANSPQLNCWSVLNLEHDEISHSLVLAWLLDARGSHAQGNLFLSELLRVAIPESDLLRSCADERYRVATEVRHARSRIDIEVIGQTFLVHFEVKINAGEGLGQTPREREDLKAKAAAKGISLDRALGLYLTTDGRQSADSEKFEPISWKAVVVAFTKAMDVVSATQPGNVHLRWVLERYVDVVHRHVLRARGSANRPEAPEWPRLPSTMLTE